MRGSQALLAELTSADPDVVVLGEEVPRGERSLDLPAAERAQLGLALGLALGGKKPVVELVSTAALAAALPVLAEATAIANAGAFRVPLVVRVPYGGQAGPRVDVPVIDRLIAIPGLAVALPCSGELSAGLLRSAVSSTHPTVILEPRGLSAGKPGEGLAVPLGTARSVRNGTHVTIAAFGPAVDASLAAADRLAERGVEAAVLDLVSVAPLDSFTLGHWARATGRLIVASPEPSSVSATLLAAAHDQAFFYWEAKPTVVAGEPGAIEDAALHAIYD